MIDVMIGTPAYAGVTVPYLHSLIQTLAIAKENGLRVVVDTEQGCSLIEQARNNTVRRFLASDAKVLFFIDSDVSWNPADFFKVLASGYDVAACAYRVKERDGSERYTCLINSGPDGCPIVYEDGFIQCQSAGTGFMAIRREVFARIESKEYADKEGPIRTWFNTTCENGVFWGEDYSFCKKFGDAGGHVMVWPDASNAHHGENKWAGNLHQFLLKSAQ